MKPFLRWLLFILIGLVVLTALFYAEENWRGKRAWENCKREFAAKGIKLNWSAYIPPPVPDDQNIFKAPKMTAWFVRLPAMPNQWLTTNDFKESEEFSKRLQANKNTTATIKTEPAARDYLAWSDQFQPEFDLMREALKRPYARMDGDYSKPNEQPIPNFAVRNVAQVLAQRAKCDLLLGQPEKALQELTLMHDMRRLLEAAPTGKPMTLVAAMFNVAVAGLYTDTVAEGLRQHTWQEPQLIVLQEQFKEINLLPIAAAAFKMETVAPVNTFAAKPTELTFLYKVADLTSHAMTSSDKEIGSFWWCLKNPMYLLLKIAPRGWYYQNMANCAVMESKPLDGFNLEQDVVTPRIFDEASRNLKKSSVHGSPFKLLAAIAIPNFSKAEQTIAHNQSMVNEAQIACALERYWLAHGEYPESLDVLLPQFIEKLPHDIIGGQPLHYRRTDGGKFLLYSVGWNETDDGGQDGGNDFTKGDWVWKN